MDGTGFNAAGAPVALLVDGDNLAAARAGQVLVAAGRLGRVSVKRVYADVQHLPGWTTGATGFVHRTAGGGKNASDLLLSVEAVDLFWRDGIRHFAIASSDRDLSVVTLYLAERGAVVLGIGEAKAPAAFRHACSRFVVVGEEAGEAPRVVPAKAPDLASQTGIDGDIFRAIRGSGEKAMTLTALHGELHRQHRDGLKSQLLGKGIRGYLASRADLYALDEPGLESKVRLIG